MINKFMTLRNAILGCCFFSASLVSIETNAQDCDNNLKIALQHATDGKLHLIHTLIDECIASEAYNKDQLLSAYKLLGNASFILDSIDQGENYIRLILNKQLNFSLGDQDAFKFRQHLEELRKHPTFQFGVKVGFNEPSLLLDDIYDDIFDRVNAENVAGLTGGDLISDHTMQTGFNLQLILIKKIINNLEVESGFGFQTTKFHYYDAVADSKKGTKVKDFTIPVHFNYYLPIQLSGNRIGLKTGPTINLLNSWATSDRLGNSLSNDQTDIRTSFNYNWSSGVFMNWKIGNFIFRPEVVYSAGLTPRSKTITDAENAALILNDPPFVNYNGRLNHFIFSLGILKQRF